MVETKHRLGKRKIHDLKKEAEYIEAGQTGLDTEKLMALERETLVSTESGVVMKKVTGAMLYGI